MALARKYQDEVVSMESSQDVQNAQQSKDKVTFSGASLFTPTFRNELVKQQKLVEEAYSKKVKGVVDPQIITKFSSVYDSAKNIFARLNEFVEEIGKCEYSDDIVTIKITRCASVYLYFAQASRRIESFSFVNQSSDVTSMSDLFSQIEKNLEFSCDSVVSFAKKIFMSMRLTCSNSLKQFVTKWIKDIDQLVANTSSDSISAKSKPVKTQAKPKRTSTTESAVKSKPPQEEFWGLLVGYDNVDDSKSKKFVVVKVSDKSVLHISNRLKRGKTYVADFYKAAEIGESGDVVPVLCYNWYEDYSDSYCVMDYYIKDDYPEFESVSGLKISDMKVIVDEYIKSL